MFFTEINDCQFVIANTFTVKCFYQRFSIYVLSSNKIAFDNFFALVHLNEH